MTVNHQMYSARRAFSYPLPVPARAAPGEAGPPLYLRPTELTTKRGMMDQFSVEVGAGSRRSDRPGTIRFPHRWTPEGVTADADFTGAHLLHLAAAGCVLNDIYREAAGLGNPRRRRPRARRGRLRPADLGIHRHHLPRRRRLARLPGRRLPPAGLRRRGGRDPARHPSRCPRAPRLTKDHFKPLFRYATAPVPSRAARPGGWARSAPGRRAGPRSLPPRSQCGPTGMPRPAARHVRGAFPTPRGSSVRS